jgi:hypothetical protein
VAMLFCQFAQAKSLREISDGLAVTCGKLIHLGLRNAPAKSTLAYANAHRPHELFVNLFSHILAICHQESPGKKKKFRFKNKLFSLDSTTIDLCLSLFPWATFRQTKGAVKLHLLVETHGQSPWHFTGQASLDLNADVRSVLKVFLANLFVIRLPAFRIFHSPTGSTRGTLPFGSLDHDGYLREFAVITDGKAHDVTVAPILVCLSAASLP